MYLYVLFKCLYMDLVGSTSIVYVYNHTMFVHHTCAQVLSKRPGATLCCLGSAAAGPSDSSTVAYCVIASRCPIWTTLLELSELETQKKFPRSYQAPMRCLCCRTRPLAGGRCCLDEKELSNSSLVNLVSTLTYPVFPILICSSDGLFLSGDAHLLHGQRRETSAPVSAWASTCRGATIHVGEPELIRFLGLMSPQACNGLSSVKTPPQELVIINGNTQKSLNLTINKFLHSCFGLLRNGYVAISSSPCF